MINAPNKTIEDFGATCFVGSIAASITFAVTSVAANVILVSLLKPSDSFFL